ncbi:MAG TPA: hypothetical protein VGE77_12840 [Nocardioides sp.]
MTALIDQAAALLDGGGAHATTRACWLARAALEDAVGDLLVAADLDVGDASGTARLTCLQVAYEEHPDLAARAEYAWSRLSEACHHHAFALAPTHGEAQHLVGLVRQFVAAAAAWHHAPTTH